MAFILKMLFYFHFNEICKFRHSGSFWYVSFFIKKKFKLLHWTPPKNYFQRTSFICKVYFFPAKFFFCIFEKEILAGKKFLCKEAYSIFKISPILNKSNSKDTSKAHKSISSFFQHPKHQDSTHKTYLRKKSFVKVQIK